MKCIVYTCVFEGYDWVFPPIQPEDDLGYMIVTDDADLVVPGWQTMVVEMENFRNSKSANLHYRALAHRLFKEYDFSLYIDGNIRLLGNTSKFFENFITSGEALRLFPHPIRSSVREEAESCLLAGKIVEPDRLKEELRYYQQEKFPDDAGLFETGIILKNHQHPDLDGAMDLWWKLFERFGTRDQISLPFVLWRTGLPYVLQPLNFRDPNPYFGLYAHKADRKAPRHYAYVEGRAYDSVFYAAILRAWHFSWAIRRFFRRS